MLCARDMTSIKISGKGHNSLGGVWVGDVLGVKFGTRNLLRVNPAGLILRVEVGGGGSIWLVLAWLGTGSEPRVRQINSGVNLAWSAFRELHLHCLGNDRWMLDVCKRTSFT